MLARLCWPPVSKAAASGEWDGQDGGRGGSGWKSAVHLVHLDLPCLPGACRKHDAFCHAMEAPCNAVQHDAAKWHMCGVHLPNHCRHVPAFIPESVPRSLYAHTSEPIDFAALKGKRVAILGGAGRCALQ